MLRIDRKFVSAAYGALFKTGNNKMESLTSLPNTIRAMSLAVGISHIIGVTVSGTRVLFQVRLDYELKPSNLISFELFPYSKVSQWGGKKSHIPLENDTVITERGLEWLRPVHPQIFEYQVNHHRRPIASGPVC